jgi:hypothetical protein
LKKSSQEAWKSIDFTHLEFGRIPTDHMFVADFKCGKWQNARIIPLCTHVSHSFYFGVALWPNRF